MACHHENVENVSAKPSAREEPKNLVSTLDNVVEYSESHTVLLSSSASKRTDRCSMEDNEKDKSLCQLQGIMWCHSIHNSNLNGSRSIITPARICYLTVFSTHRCSTQIVLFPVGKSPHTSLRIPSIMTKSWDDARDKALLIALLDPNLEVPRKKFDEASALLSGGGGEITWNACR